VACLKIAQTATVGVSQGNLALSRGAQDDRELPPGRKSMVAW
jgi:hypothetical protein